MNLIDFQEEFKAKFEQGYINENEFTVFLDKLNITYIKIVNDREATIATFLESEWYGIYLISSVDTFKVPAHLITDFLEDHKLDKSSIESMLNDAKNNVAAIEKLLDSTYVNSLKLQNIFTGN